jgi:hypothetical protein
VVVNGAKISGERELTAGDRIAIGSQEMVLHTAADASPAAHAAQDEMYRRATQTLGAAYVADLRSAVDAQREGEPASPARGGGGIADPPTAEASRSVQSFQLLGGVANKALAMGKAEDAERILLVLLTDVLSRARDGQVLDPSVSEPAAHFAAKLAGATAKASWLDYTFELYRRLRRVLPAPVVDELYAGVRKIKNVDLTAIRGYLEVLREAAPGFGPADRFLFQRIEGLERQMALK